jgi:hypothetical protein
MKTKLLLYRIALHMLPRKFRERHGREMMEIVRARVAEEGTYGLMAECANVMIIALRIRFGRYPLQVPALVVIALLLVLVRSERAPVLSDATSPSDSIDFQATDPAGEFTLQVRAGRAVAGSIDRKPLSRQQLVHAGDSIRVLNPSGRVLFAVAYNRSTASIEWEARPARCRGRALECGAYQ